MNISEIAQNLYIKNMNFLNLNHPELFKKLKTFEQAIELEEYECKYLLDYKEGYFDIYDIDKKEYFYNENSLHYSKELVRNVNFNVNENTFKTFYEKNYTDEVVDYIKNASITSHVDINNAEISHYIQKNMPIKQDMKNIYKYFIFGIGLGIHIDLIHNKISAKKYLLIEPSLEIFRLSLFITDYENLSNSTELHFAISLNEDSFYNFISFLSAETFLYDQYIKFFIFSKNCDMYINSIQNYLVSQKHILYSYDRAIESLQRTYKYVEEEFKYLKLADSQIFDKPVLLLAAGPSLSNNIEFVKKNKDKFIIVAIYVILPYLEENGIIPDIITQYDQQDSNVMKTLESVKDKSFLKDTIFLFASHLVDKLMYSFEKNKIFVFQGLYDVKVDYGKLTSPSIGEITYGLLSKLGIEDDIYLLGLDMALSKSGETHITNHVESNSFEGISEKGAENISFRTSIIKVKGNFDNEVDSLPLFKVSIIAMNRFLRNLKSHTNVYNLSPGAYFNNTIPILPSDINVSNMKTINKNLFSENLIKKLNNLSSSLISENDIEYNIKKEKNAKELYDEVKKFHNIKYGSIESYKKSIFKLFENVIYKDCLCIDLQDILLNFYKYNLPYIFHLFNMKGLSNPKKHINKLNNILYKQTDKIFIVYLKSLESVIK